MSHGFTLHCSDMPLTIAPVARTHVPFAWSLVILAALGLAGCGTTDVVSAEKVDYRSVGARSVTLEVPPDLSQFPADARFGVPVGTDVSAGPATVGASVSAASPAATVAPSQIGTARIMRAGDVRWIASGETPDRLWPRLKEFWVESGMQIALEDPRVGLIETEWAENRAKIKDDFIRRSIGRLFDRAYDSGERDRYIMRVEPTATGSEVRITHRGMEEVYTDAQKTSTKWQARATDPELEAVMLARLLGKLGAAAPAEAKDNQPAVNRARPADGGDGRVLQVKDTLDNTWRMVTTALDRAAYITEERDRRKAQLLVRPPDGQTNSDKPGVLKRIFQGDADKDKAKPATPRHRVLIQGSGDQSTVSVQDANGQPDKSDSAKALADLLLKALN